jgi:hypothetical protein
MSGHDELQAMLLYDQLAQKGANTGESWARLGGVIQSGICVDVESHSSRRSQKWIFWRRREDNCNQSSDGDFTEKKAKTETRGMYPVESPVRIGCD